MVAVLTVLVLGYLFVYLRANPQARPKARRWGFALFIVAFLSFIGGWFFISADGESIFLGLLTISSFYVIPLLVVVGMYLVAAGSRTP